MSGSRTKEDVLIALRRIMRAVDLHSRDLIQRYGLTGPQLILLREISRADEISGTDLAAAVSLSLPTVTGILGRLEDRGLVERRRSELDRRRILVRATSAALGILDAAPPLLQESFVHQFDRLRDWEQTQILSTLQRLVAMMEAKDLAASPILDAGSLDPAGSTESSKV